jgi:Ni,Fe-hydrogenase I large subunit
LFSVCSHAQAYAALQACSSALGIVPESKFEAAREMLVQLEILREQCWRILLDWPGFVGMAADKKSLKSLMAFDAQFKMALFLDGQGFNLDSVLSVNTERLTTLIDEVALLIDAVIFNGDLYGFMAIVNEEELLGWLRDNKSLPAYLLNDVYRRNWQAIGQNKVGCLPELDRLSLNRLMEQEDLSVYSQFPHWQGRCFETTVLNRQRQQPLIIALEARYQNGLLVRILARLLEVSQVLANLRLLLNTINDDFCVTINTGLGRNIGLGKVQAARGLLIHRVELWQGRIKDYCIVAPTEWNFHPQGVVAQSLKSLQANDSEPLLQQAKLLINSIDPCVQYDLRLIDSDKAQSTHA